MSFGYVRKNTLSKHVHLYRVSWTLQNLRNHLCSKMANGYATGMAIHLGGVKEPRLALCLYPTHSL
jgi:hypothetical protein